MTTALRILGLGLALCASPAVACDTLIWATPYCGSVAVWSNCNPQYREVLRAPRTTGEMVLHLHWGITKDCRDQAFDRWGCAILKCFGIGRGKTCPAISAACWRQIN